MNHLPLLLHLAEPGFSDFHTRKAPFSSQPGAMPLLRPLGAGRGAGTDMRLPVLPEPGK